MTPPSRSPESIYLEAAELESLEQERFLAQVCSGDESLRHAVERLRHAERSAESGIRQAIEAEAGRAAGRRHIGPYRVLRQLGQGGMGTVYLAARDDDEFEKVVAIKVARAAIDLADGGARFRHERQILARLEHPFIARLLDGGATPDGEPYLVMEYVDGEPVTRYAAAHSLDVRAALALILKVATAVEYAHRHLVVHRDL